MALETKGKPVCRSKSTGKLCFTPECDCKTDRSGVGVMQFLTSTASHYAGRPVSARELMSDHALSIELAARYWEDQLAKYDGDPMHAAAAYVAGSVKCGRGSTYTKPGEKCPPTDWGVVVGCDYSSKSYGRRCSPSTAEGKPAYVCSDDYPRTFARLVNGAVENFLGAGPAPPSPTPTGPSSPWKNFAVFSSGVLLGFHALRWLRS
jgi:hypothetical protein